MSRFGIAQANRARHDTAHESNRFKLGSIVMTAITAASATISIRAPADFVDRASAKVSESVSHGESNGRVSHRTACRTVATRIVQEKK
jgi:hypothetical protein